MRIAGSLCVRARVASLTSRGQGLAFVTRKGWTRGVQPFVLPVVCR